MGLGHFGGGIGAARWLVQQRAEVTVTDQASADELAHGLAELEGLPIRFHLGGHDPADLDHCDLLVVSPAIPKDRSDFVAAAVARGIPLSSEMNLFIVRCPAQRVVGITGSAGKSTTTAMLGAILQNAFPSTGRPRAWVGGNIGRSLLGDLQAMSPEDIVVLELSSFQLEDLARLRWSPRMAVITNIQPNHLDRHGTFESYVDAKMNIVRHQSPQDMVFVHGEDEALAEQVKRVGAASRMMRFAFDPVFGDCLRLPGRHNRDNAAAAIAAARALGIADETIARGLSGFNGLPHRLEFVGEHKGVRYFNDSKSTTPESTCIALRAFDEPVIMLVGGQGKGMPFDQLGRELAARAKAVICYGKTRYELYKEVSSPDGGGGGRRAAAHIAESFEAAVATAGELAAAGDVVILSPACASYDMFTNYEHRGDAFRQIVRRMSGSV